MTSNRLLCALLLDAQCRAYHADDERIQPIFGAACAFRPPVSHGSDVCDDERELARRHAVNLWDPPTETPIDQLLFGEGSAVGSSGEFFLDAEPQ